MTGTSYYLVFEYCNGGDLREMFVHHNCMLAADTVQYVLKSVAQGLEAMHTGFNFIHRDLKPENILLNAP